MKHSLFICFLIFYPITIFASNDSIPLEKSKPSSGGMRRVPVGRNYRNALPMSDRPMGDLPIQRRRSLDTNPQPLSTTPKPGLVTEGRTAEDNLTDPWTYKPTKRYLNRWFRDITGFRVFLGKGLTLGIGNNYNYRVDIYGSFGYQFNPIFFVGIGQGYSISVNGEESTAPSFANVRVNFLDENTTPFLDLKAGYSFVAGEGLFLHPNFGYSFAKNNHAWNISAGYSYQKVSGRNKGVKYKYRYHGISLKLTYEFSIFK